MTRQTANHMVIWYDGDLIRTGPRCVWWERLACRDTGPALIDIDRKMSVPEWTTLDQDRKCECRGYFCGMARRELTHGITRTCINWSWCPVWLSVCFCIGGGKIKETEITAINQRLGCCFVRCRCLSHQLFVDVRGVCTLSRWAVLTLAWRCF